MNQTPRTDPPYAADEATMMRSFLDYFRDTLRRQTEDLPSSALNARLEPSTLTLGGILKHLAFVENYWWRYVFEGGEQTEPWASADWDADADWEMTSAAADSPEELRALYDVEVGAADLVLDKVLAGDGLDALAARGRHGSHASVRWILLHLIEEYARHCGHADLIRESVDGATDL